MQIQPLSTFAKVPLVPETKAYREIKSDDSISILMPQHLLYPMSKFHVPVFLHQLQNHEISIFSMRARVKSGLKILEATSSSDCWNISMEKENTKHTSARVTAFKKDGENCLSNNTESENNRLNFDLVIFEKIVAQKCIFTELTRYLAGYYKFRMI